MSKLSLFLLLTLCHFQTGFSQNHDEVTLTKIKVKYFAAEKLLQEKEYAEVIDKVEEIEALTNGPEASVVQNLKVKAYIGLGEYERAKDELNVLYKLSPTNEVLADIARYESSIDDGIEKENRRKENERVAEIKRKKEERLLEEKKRELKRLEDVLISIDNKQLGDKEFAAQLRSAANMADTSIVTRADVIFVINAFGYRLSKDNTAKAIIVYEYLTKAKPGDQDLWYRLARCYFTSSEYDMAETYFHKTYSLAPGSQSGKEAKKQLESIPEKKYEKYLSYALANDRFIDAKGNYTSKEKAIKLLRTEKDSSNGMHYVSEWDVANECWLSKTSYKIIPNPFIDSIKNGWSYDFILNKTSTGVFYHMNRIKQAINFKVASGTDGEFIFAFVSYKGEVVFRSTDSHIYEASYNSLGGFYTLTIAAAKMKGKKNIEFNKISFDNSGNMTYLMVKDRNGKILRQYKYSK